MTLPQAAQVETAPDPAERLRQRLVHLQDLPASLLVIREAIAASEDPKISNTRLQSILARDPGATAGVLRLANSPYFGLGHEVSSVSMAITIIGYLRLGILLRHLMVSRLIETFKTRGERMNRARELALAAGVASQLLGEALGRSDTEQLMVAGLLHNIGDLALNSEFPEESARLAGMCESMPRRQAELAVFGATSSMVNGWLLSAWRFPQMLVNAAHHWEAPGHPDLSPSDRKFVGTVHVGVKLAGRYLDDWRWNPDDLPVLGPLLDSLRMTKGCLEFAYEQIGPRLEKLRHSIC